MCLSYGCFTLSCVPDAADLVNIVPRSHIVCICLLRLPIDPMDFPPPILIAVNLNIIVVVVDDFFLSRESFVLSIFLQFLHSDISYTHHKHRFHSLNCFVDFN